MKQINSFAKLSQTNQIHELTEVAKLAAVEFGITIKNIVNEIGRAHV